MGYVCMVGVLLWDRLGREGGHHGIGDAKTMHGQWLQGDKIMSLTA
jgi:hypothetical protein